MPDDNNILLAKLEELQQRHSRLERQISDPAVAADAKKLVALAKQQAKLAPIVAKYREYRKTTDALAEARKMLEDALLEQELRALASEELTHLQAKQSVLLEEIKDTLVMADDAAINSVIMEIRAGTGGGEAALFARALYNMYVRYAEKQHFIIEQLDFSPT